MEKEKEREAQNCKKVVQSLHNSEIEVSATCLITESEWDIFLIASIK
jgi:hypothetical protein